MGEKQEIPSNIYSPDPAEIAYMNLFEQGRVKFSLKQYVDAVHAFGQALTYKPYAPECHYMLALSFSFLNDGMNAENEARELLRIEPNTPRSHYALATALSTQKKYKSAIGSFKKSIKLNPNWESPYVDLSRTYLITKQYALAAKSAEDALKINPQSAHGHINLGVAYKRMFYRHKATKEIESALSINPNSAIAHFNIGVIKQAGRRESQRSIREALRLDPNNNLYQSWYKNYFLRKNNFLLVSFLVASIIFFNFYYQSGDFEQLPVYEQAIIALIIISLLILLRWLAFHTRGFVERLRYIRLNSE